MTNATDTLAAGRDLARRIEDADGDPSPDAETVRALCDEVARLRAACASLGPCVPERLTRYRCAALSGTLARTGARIEVTEAIETMAHAMLRAEREPDAR